MRPARSSSAELHAGLPPARDMPSSALAARRLAALASTIPIHKPCREHVFVPDITHVAGVEAADATSARQLAPGFAAGLLPARDIPSKHWGDRWPLV